MVWRHWTIAGLLLLLVIAAGGAFIATRDSARPPTPATSADTPLVDQSPLKTARQLAQLGITPEEQRLAQEALRLAAEHPTDLDPKYEDLHLRIQLAQSTLTYEQARLNELHAEVASAKPDEKEKLQEQVDLLEAQEALDEDELEDASQELIRAGGNPEGKMK